MTEERRPVVPVLKDHPLAEELAPPDNSAKIDKLMARLTSLEPLRDFTTQPGWKDFDGLLELHEQLAIESMIHEAKSMEEYLLYRARVKVYRWVRGLPESFVKTIETTRAQLEELEEEEADAT